MKKKEFLLVLVKNKGIIYKDNEMKNVKYVNGKKIEKFQILEIVKKNIILILLKLSLDIIYKQK